MNYYLVLYLYPIVSLSYVAFAKHLRLIGGEETDIKEFPYVASLRLYEKQKNCGIAIITDWNISKNMFINKRHLCGGAIITNRHILTAAHCLNTRNATDIRIYVGRTTTTSYSKPYYKIQKTYLHPEFKTMDTEDFDIRNDIAVILLDSIIPFNEFQNKIQLPTHDLKPDDIGTITGWGWDSHPVGDLSETLKKTSMKIITNEACNKDFPNMIRDQQFCAFQGLGVGICFGDSGGPFVIDNKLYGIASFAYPCAVGRADVYTRVYKYLNFIHNSVIEVQMAFPCINL